ncbi:hypothetical protein KQI48_06290 [Cellulomonas hominis]|uniref:hypothetical protein n=1 Tax=Cellulomonas hominis TaxID=156981 RepID=UPI001C0F7426|nr:hypothetical protein [Cellulomonas hominis]MBU5422269.1 hypothetical protein [Cellulomonas hominis]
MHPSRQRTGGRIRRVAALLATAFVAVLVPASPALAHDVSLVPRSPEGVGTVTYDVSCDMVDSTRLGFSGWLLQSNVDWTIVQRGDVTVAEDTLEHRSGTFSVDYGVLAPGTYTLQSGCYVNAQSSAPKLRTVTVPRVATSTTVSADPTVVEERGVSTLTARVVGSESGSVRFVDTADGAVLDTVQLGDGVARSVLPFARTTTVRAEFLGTASAAPSSSTVTVTVQRQMTAPLLVALPAQAPVGAPVAPSADGWSPADLTFTYLWEIGGEVVGRAPTYIPTADQLGAALTVKVTGHGDGLPDTTVGSTTATVVAGEMPAGDLRVDGPVDGHAQVGTPLAARPTSFPGDARFTYSWVVGGVERSTTDSYTPTAADLGATIRLTVGVTATGYTGTEVWTSLAVAPATPVVTVEAATAAFGADVTVPVRVAGPQGGPVPAGDVALTLVPRGGGDTISTPASALEDGATRIAVAGLPVGVYDVTASYLPADLRHTRSVGFSGPYTEAAGTGTVTITRLAPQVTVDAGSVPVATRGTVTVGVHGEHRPASYVLREGSTVLAQGALASGTTTITLPVLAPGTHRLVLELPETATTAAVSRTVTVTVAGEPDRSGALPTADLASPEKASAPGQEMELVATGFQPGETVAFYLHSEPVLLGTAVAGADGVARLTVAVPADVPAGAHTVYATGGTSGRWAALPVELAVPAAAPAAVTPAAPAAAPGAALATTGAEGGVLTTLAWTLLLAGAGLVVLARRVRAAR